MSVNQKPARSYVRVQEKEKQMTMPGDNGMMKTTIVFLLAGESEDQYRALSPIGEVQVRSFAEALQGRNLLPLDAIFVASEESDTWYAAQIVREVYGGPDCRFLKRLAFPQKAQHMAEGLRTLMTDYPDRPIEAFCHESEFQLLNIHSLQAQRELSSLIDNGKHLRILVCSRYAHILSNLACYWATKMVAAGFRLCDGTAIVNPDDIYRDAREFVLRPGEGLVMRYDAATPESRAIAPIRRIVGTTKI